jgi:phage terminase large subunit
MTSSVTNAPLDLLSLVVPAYHKFFESTKFYCVLRGGRSAGKSVAIAQKIIWRCISEKNHRFVVIRDKMTDHYNSTYQELRSAIISMGIEEHCEFFKSPTRIKLTTFKSEILFVGLDDPQRLKGLSGMTGIWFEEPSEIKEQAVFEETMSGFRPRPGSVSYAQIYLSFNPISIDHWLKKRFYDENPDADRTFALKTTYLDNPHLSTDTVRTLLNLKSTDPVKYTVNVLGEWGRTQNGGEYYKNFKYGEHVEEATSFKQITDTLYNKALPLHISFDFNLVPHMTMIVAQKSGKTIKIIDEIIAENPYNTVYGICQKFKNSEYGNHNTGLIIHGDPSGHNKSVNNIDNRTSYTLILEELRHMHPVLKVDRQFPPVSIRGQWLNRIFAQQDEINVLIHPKCLGLIRDFTEMKEDAEGKKMKEKIMKNGIRFEKYGHWSDAFDYLMTTLFSDEWHMFYKGGSSGVTSIVSAPLPKPKYLI